MFKKSKYLLLPLKQDLENWKNDRQIQRIITSHLSAIEESLQIGELQQKEIFEYLFSSEDYQKIPFTNFLNWLHRARKKNIQNEQKEVNKRLEIEKSSLTKIAIRDTYELLKNFNSELKLSTENLLAEHKTALTALQIKLIEDTNQKLRQRTAEFREELQDLTINFDSKVNTIEKTLLNHHKKPVAKRFYILFVTLLILFNIALNASVLVKMQLKENRIVEKYQKGLVIGFEKVEKSINPKESEKVKKIIIEEIDKQLKEN